MRIKDKYSIDLKKIRYCIRIERTEDEIQINWAQTIALPLVSIGKNNEATIARRETLPYSPIATLSESCTKTWATKGVIIAPRRAMPLHTPIPTERRYVGYTSGV